MKFPIWLSIATLVLSGAAGCRTPQGFHEMETELRSQEDRIYQLEEWCRQYHDQLDSCRTENTALRAKLGPDGKPAKSVRVAPFEEAGPRGPKVPDVEIPVPEVEIPNVETPPQPMRPQRQGVPPRQVPDGGATNRRRRRAIPDAAVAVANQPPSADLVAFSMAMEEATAEAAAERASHVHLSSYEATATQDNTVARITLNRMLTSGLNRDGLPGDEGVMVMVEPRNAANELIPPTGELSISVIDPGAKTSADAHVARWNFGAAETARLYHRATLGDGIELNLLWPNRPPVHRRLMIYARLTTPEGRKLIARQVIEITPPPSTPTVAAPTVTAKAAVAPEEATAADETPSESDQQLSPEPSPPAKLAATDDRIFEIQPVSAEPVSREQSVLNRRAAIQPPPVPSGPVPVAPVPQAPKATAPLPLPTQPPADEQVALPAEAGTVPVVPAAPPRNRPVRNGPRSGSTTAVENIAPTV